MYFTYLTLFANKIRSTFAKEVTFSVRISNSIVSTLVIKQCIINSSFIYQRSLNFTWTLASGTKEALNTLM
jgi:hypothetical protein